MPDRSVPGRTVGKSDRPALRRCIAIGNEGVDEFARRHWSREPLHSRAAELPQPFDDLLSLTDVDELLSRRGLRTPFLRVARDGDVLATSRFTRGGGVGAEIGDQVADDRVLDLFADGATLVLQGLHRVWPPLMDFTAQLVSDLGHPAQVNAYVTPPSSRGFSAHYDTHDVFVLQVAGAKCWRLHDPVRPAPLRDEPWTDRRREVALAAEGEPALEVVLREGDALYLPRGTLHSAEALGDVSCHLTVGVHPITREELIRLLVRQALEDPALRASLPLGVDVADPFDLADDLGATVRALTAALLRADPVLLAAGMSDRYLAATRPGPIAPLAQAASLAALRGTDVVALRPHLRCRLDPTGPALVLPGRSVPLAADCIDAVRRLLTGEPIAVTDLPGLAPEQRLELGRLLLREAVIVPASAAPAPR